MSKYISIIILAVSLSIASIVYADVPVINGYDSDNNQGGEVIVTDQADGGATISTSRSATDAPTTPATNSSLPIKQRVTILERQVSNLTQLLAQVNQLQSQIQDLRGEVEVQKHTIKVLQDQVRSQYQDLDQRLSAQSKSASEKANKVAANSSNTAATTAKVSSNKTTSNASNVTADDNSTTDDNSSDNAASDKSNQAATQTVAASASAKNNDQKAYQAAIDLLKNKKYAQATTAFQKFIKQYPSSQQTSNARFWLGQLYLLQGQPDRALEEFHVVMKKDPTNKKTPDILLQVGLAYYAKGDMTHAQAAFKKVIQKYPNTSAAKLAQTRLKVIQQASTDQTTSSAST